MMGLGNGTCGGRRLRGRFGKLMPRVSASIISSRAVITQSTSRTDRVEDGSVDEGRQ